MRSVSVSATGCGGAGSGGASVFAANPGTPASDRLLAAACGTGA